MTVPESIRRCPVVFGSLCNRLNLLRRKPPSESAVCPYHLPGIRMMVLLAVDTPEVMAGGCHKEDFRVKRFPHLLRCPPVQVHGIFNHIPGMVLAVGRVKGRIPRDYLTKDIFRYTGPYLREGGYERFSVSV